MIKTLLIANRGEIACRVIRSAKKLGINTVAVYSTVDRNAQHVKQADQAVCIGPALASESYLSINAIIDAAKQTGADAVHPGYGFLSENPEFVDACVANGICFVGPSAAAMRAMGRKDAAKLLMEKAGVPVVPGYHGENQDSEFLAEQARAIGYPVLIKARSGGGGKGMRRVDDAKDFAASLESAQREAQASFSDAHVLIEKYVSKPRHIEVQVFGDSHGNVVHLFERDCSLQRRHQKVIEEAPAPGMTAEVRHAMTQAAMKAARAIDYEGAGTIEFIVDGSSGLRTDGFWFMEMNTRLQVEHPVTEAITGVDLVEWQLKAASGHKIPKGQEKLTIQGHAVEARLYAEDPVAGFLPATGRLQHLEFSNAGRVDSGVVEGDEILPYYDPLLAKLITHSPDRLSAFRTLADQLATTTVLGTKTNREFLWRLLSHPKVCGGDFDTSFIDVNLQKLVDKTNEAGLIAAACHELINPAAPNGASDSNPTTAQQIGCWQIWGSCERCVEVGVEGVVHSLRACEADEGGWVIYCDSLENYPKSGVRFRRLSSSRSAVDGIDVPVYVVPTDEQIHVQIGAQSASYDRVVAGGDASSGSADDAIVAPMPGRIVAVHCKVGESVSTGQALISIEAMKMEQDLCASRDGVVEILAVAAGDQVAQGDELLRLAPVTDT